MRAARRTLALGLAALLMPALAGAGGASAADPESMSWSVVSRFGGDADGDGRLDRDTDRSPADLDTFPVLVAPPRAACRGGSARWLLDGEATRPIEVPRPRGEPCRVLFHARGEGGHRIELTAGSRRAVARVQVDDKLVVALGDSVASGEGNPSGKRRWLDTPCHRSAAAGLEQATRLLAEALDRRSITFVSLACSGAEVREGLLEPYAGVAPARDGSRYRPQVDRLAALARARAADGAGRRGRASRPAVDAVLVSIGANDVRFSQVVKHCLLPGDCRGSEDGRVFSDLQALGPRFDALAPRLRAAAPGAPVLLTEYFDPTRDAHGRFCRLSVGATTRAEARFAFESLLRPLNAEVSAAAQRHGWESIGGIADDFARHGYCAPRAEQWVRRIGRSLLSQGDLVGTLHPNERGHLAIAERVVRRLDRVLGLPAPPPTKDEDEGTSPLVWIAIAAGVLLLALIAASLVLRLRREPPERRRAAALSWAASPFVALWDLLVRLWRLARPRARRDPCDLTPAPPELNLPQVNRWRDVLVPVGIAAGLIVLAAVFAGVVGAAILWVRFWSARLPADQAVDAVSSGELATTGTQALALFAVLGLLATVFVWVLEGKGQWVRATRRGLAVIIVLELLAAILIEGYRRDQALELIGGFVAGALLLHFLVDRALVAVPALRSGASLGPAVLASLRRLLRAPTDGDRLHPLLLLWRAAPLALLVYALVRSGDADGADRWLFVVLPFAVATILFVLPGAIAHRATEEKLPSERTLGALSPPQVVLSVVAFACLAVFLARDEAWLAGAAVVAVLLAGACLAIAAASGQRFAPYGLAVLIAVPLFGAAMAMLRSVNSPELQPVAVLLDDGTSVCGAYVGESGGRLWVARVELSELGDVRRPPPRRGRISPIPVDDVVARSLGPLQAVARAQDQAVVLRDELLDTHGGQVAAKPRDPTCVARAATPKPDPSPQRELAELFQPELIIDRKDGFWPVPVRTLFAMQDRRARACRAIGGGQKKPCVRLTTPGEFPWAGGEDESIEYPAADNRRDEQHDLMVDALGTVDPAKSSREYFLVMGDERDLRPAGGPRRDLRPITLQYWFFYPFNYQPLNEPLTRITAGYHEGDFESVGVLLSARTRRPRYVWTARHDDEGRVFPWDDDAVQKTGDHVRVFAARGSHASYESCQRQPRFKAPGGLIDDRPTCKVSRQMHLAPESTPLTDLARVPFACWHGLFGHRRRGGYQRIPNLVADAPLSPLWQQRFGGVVSEPCRGIEDPGGREGRGEELLEEDTGVPDRLRKGAGRLEPLIDECADWERAPATGTYMVACNQDTLRRYIESGLEEPGTAGVRIDLADVEKPRVGSLSLPALRRDPAGVYLDSWRLTAAHRARVDVFASCRQGGSRMVAARFAGVTVDPAWPLRLSDRDPRGWRLRREDGTVVARANPYRVRGKKAERGRRLACRRP